MTSTTLADVLDQARAYANDPRLGWANTHGAEVLAVLRRLLRHVDIVVAESQIHAQLAAESAVVADSFRESWSGQAREVNNLSAAVGKVLDLHQRSVTGGCSSCAVEYPCATVLAVLGKDRP